MHFRTCIAALAIACAPIVASAAIWTDGFDTAATSSNYNVYSTPGATGPSSDALFGYDYSALGIPQAPNTPAGTVTKTGLRLRADSLQAATSGSVVGAISVITKGLTLPSQYVVSVDVWSNYIGAAGGISSSGSNGTTGVTVGIGTNGNSNQYIAANNGFLVEAFGDNGGGADNAYRLYLGNTKAAVTSGYFAAGNTAGAASYTHSYYTSLFPSVSAPSVQSSAASTQTGSTAAGTIGFAWHVFTITRDDTNITWAIDGTTIATVPNSAVTLSGMQVSLGNSDTGTSGNYTAPATTYNAQIFDNFTITALPEPASLSLLGLGSLALLKRRRNA